MSAAVTPPASPRITHGAAFWPSERVYLVVTAAGRLSVKNGKPLAFLDYGAARIAAGSDKFVAAANILRVQVL